MTEYQEQILELYKDWIGISVMAEEKEIEKEFKIPKKTLQRWRLNIDKSGPQYFKKDQTILYPRKVFILWMVENMKNKHTFGSQPVSTENNVSKLRK